jgi:hypothetical protein
MGTASSDRARLRTDLRELAKLAAPVSSAPAPHALRSPDSSGYVDLSAFNSTDDMDGWVERELAASGGRAKGGAVLTPGSMAPVAMSALIDAAPGPDETSAGSRKRGWVYSGLGVVGVAAVAVLAVTLARHPPPFLKSAPQPPAAAATVAPPPPAAMAVTAPIEVASTPAPAPSVPMAVTVSAPDPGMGAKKKHGAAKHGRGASVPPAAVAAAARPAQPAPAKVSIPAAHGSGGDSLMDMMRASVNAPK